MDFNFSGLLRTCGLATFLAFFLVCPATAQETAQSPADDELQQVEALIKQGQEEASQFRQKGGKEGDPDHPGRKWATTLWEYREKHPGTPAAARATAESLHFLIHAGQVDEAIAQGVALPADDGAWRHLSDFLLEAARMKKEYGFFIQKVNSVLGAVSDAEIRSRLHFTLAEAYWKHGDLEPARRAYEAVVAEAPESRRAATAKENIYELTHLQPGQPAPAFAVRARNGEEIRLADYRGRPVVLIFWATW